MASTGFPLKLVSSLSLDECISRLHDLDGKAPFQARLEVSTTAVNGRRADFQIQAHNGNWSGLDSIQTQIGYFINVTEVDVIGHLESNSSQTTAVVIDQVTRGKAFRNRLLILLGLSMLICVLWFGVVISTSLLLTLMASALLTALVGVRTWVRHLTDRYKCFDLIQTTLNATYEGRRSE